MRWFPRSQMEMKGLVLDPNHKMRSAAWNVERDLVRRPRINHSLTVVGSHLCIFGGTDESEVLVITDFVNTANSMGARCQQQQRDEGGGYGQTNALSLSKHLFGTSPAEYEETTYTSMVQCAHCLVLECNRFNFRTCSGCAQVQYCSKLCQKNHWNNNHSLLCSKNHIQRAS